MPTVSAEVQVLTAEVRVLMVGSRQVTLSVYRQLDRVESANCAPFGRVSDTKDSEPGVHVVGVHTETGVLVTAHREPVGLTWWLNGGEYPWAAEYCALSGFSWKNRPTWSGYRVPELNLATGPDGTRVRMELPQPARLPYDGERYRGEWDFEPSGLSLEEMQSSLAEEAADGLRRLLAKRRAYDDWRNLPLIVLAGLR